MNGIFERITSAENCFAAWREFRRGKRQKPDVQAFERHLEGNIFDLRSDLLCGSYHHGPYHRFPIHDPKPRVIHKATVRDRLLHQAVVRILGPMFERSYLLDSYSCQKRKGPHAAIRRLEVFRRRVSRNGTRPSWTLKFDIANFFASVDHIILLDVLAGRVRCLRTLGLVTEIVESYAVAGALGGGGRLRARQPANGTPAWQRNFAAVRQHVSRCIRPLYQGAPSNSLLSAVHRRCAHSPSRSSHSSVAGTHSRFLALARAAASSPPKKN